ncbi:aminodeoxychorismate synthase component 1 [Martelella alba]|uniref:aminodeoxychorismate synthase n=1 Tax=Martelella alba TaxID=2590451 RepID=A0ABY2SQE4_9HYPH|nr:aminodeoxychorismate synthase component 1 [Martelella alba]TKI08190.1 aminodeoxychorismate synthase component 1 [Martelella alba]
MSAKSPQLIELPYRPEAIVEAFAPYSARPWSALLHSGHADHPDSRFDIMVASPAATLVTRGKDTEIRRGDHIWHSDGCPFDLLRQQLDSLNIRPDAMEDLPFLGGALGLFGYDLARRLETLPCHAERDIDLPDMAVGIYDWAVIADHRRRRLTLLSYTDAAGRAAELQSARRPAAAPFRLTGSWESNMSRRQYGERFRRIQAHLLAGDCYQVCLAQRFTAPYQGDEWPAFLRLLAGNRAPFSAFIRLHGQAVLSLSPERFLQVRHRQIQTRPIKGTLPRLPGARQDRLQGERLAASAKDRAENLMIVDLLRNDIGRIAQPGSVRVPELFKIEAFPAVHHMVSTITAMLPPERHPSELLRACFPGGSITGAPKVSAMQIIDRLEPHRRNAWCGSIGYLSFCGSMDCNIAIRTLIAERRRLHCWAGGGIVADSREEAEYQETLDKLAAILPVLEAPNDHEYA